MAISIWARLLFGTSLLSSAILATSYSQATIILLLTIILMAWRGQLSQLWRALRYLRWLLLPIMLLHLAFSPGILLFPSLPWSPSREGVDAALWQSLRLINWFLAGWLLASLLSHREWQALVMRSPKIGRHWTMVLVSLPAMLQRCQQSIQQMRWRWKHECGRWHHIPSVAASMVAMVLRQSATQAEKHWLSITNPTTLPQKNLQMSISPPPQAWTQTTLVAVAWGIFWLLW